MIEDYSWKEQEEGIIHALCKLDSGLEAQIELIPRDEIVPYLVNITIYSEREDRLEELYKEALFVNEFDAPKNLYFVDLIDEQSDFFYIYDNCVMIEGKASCLIDAKRVADHFMIPFKDRLGISAND